MKRVLTDQAGSFAGSLTDATVRHGDEAEVLITVGSPANPTGGLPTQAFCSSVVTLVRVLREGTREEHGHPIGGEIEIVGDEQLAAAIAKQSAKVSEYGSWHTYRAKVHTNGHIRVTPMPETLVVTPADPGDSLTHRDGKPRARKLQAAYAAA